MRASQAAEIDRWDVVLSATGVKHLVGSYVTLAGVVRVETLCGKRVGTEMDSVIVAGPWERSGACRKCWDAHKRIGIKL